MEHPSHIMARYGLRPKRSLGQNFLFDESILLRIAEAAELEPGDEVLEIGSGLGSLTSVLAKEAARVVAVELDERLIPIIQAQVPAAHVTVVHGDILDFDPEANFATRPYKVVGNVPYYITGAILRHMLEAVRPPERMVLTVQREVAARLLAEPGQLSVLAVSVLFYGEPSLVGVVKAGAFWPRPGVDSAIVRIDVRDRSPGDVPAAQFFKLVRAGFAQKRKQLKNSLRTLGLGPEREQAALAAAGIDGRRRAETLTIAEWEELTRAMWP